MPSLRYGRDITDDAAQLQRLITENLGRANNADLSPEDRARAREIALNSIETVRGVFGNMRTLRLFASEAGQKPDGSYTSEGRQAAGLNGTVQTKQPLSKAAHAAYKRLEARGTVGGMKAFDNNDGSSPVNYAAGNMRLAEQAGRQVSPRFARGRAAASERGGRKVIQEAAGPKKTGKPVKEVASAKTVRQAANVTKSRAARNSRAAAKRKKP